MYLCVVTGTYMHVVSGAAVAVSSVVDDASLCCQFSRYSTVP